jgi:hypothetical protein
MERSESIVKLSKALVSAQAEMGGAAKGKTNPHFKSKYADLESVMEAIKPVIAKHALAFIQVGHDADSAAGIETIILHDSGEWLSAGKTLVPVSKSDAQGYGSALTYARRYSLMAAFGVAPEDDDGNAAASAPPAEKSAIGKAFPVAHQSVAKDVFDTMPLDVQTALRDQAAEISALFYKNDERGTFDHYSEVNREYTTEEKAALWACLDSKVRSCIKRVGQVAREIGATAA